MYANRSLYALLGGICISLIACGETYQPDERGQTTPRALGKADSTLSCVGFCGKKAPGGCWCDEQCAAYGDCCADKAPACDGGGGSCQGACGGKSKDGCWCDAECATYGDCCADKAERCGGGALADCKSDGDCDATVGLRCNGIPSDGSTPWGRCVSQKALPGEGASCGPQQSCGAELICVGLESWGSGSCSPAWMGVDLDDAAQSAIPDAKFWGKEGVLERQVVVYGLATVPVDMAVELKLTHPRPADLKVTVVDPNGVEGAVWDGAQGPLPARARILGIPGDDSVNGRWTLRIRDRKSGAKGRLESWKLSLTSRWD